MNGKHFWISLVILVFFGCGDENLLEDIAADNSSQAKQESAQAALDRGDCETAVRLYSELQSVDSEDVGLRMDLAAAHVCRAGFDVTTLVDISADFGGGTLSQSQLFRTVADKAVTTLTDTWPQDINAAEVLLSDDPTASPLVAYRNNPDAGFNLAVIELIESVLIIADILNYVNGALDCAASTGSSGFSNCQITAQDALDIVNALQGSSAVLTSLGIASDVTDTVNTVISDMDADASGVISCPEIVQYLEAQQVSSPGEVSCV